MIAIVEVLSDYITFFSAPMSSISRITVACVVLQADSILAGRIANN